MFLQPAYSSVKINYTEGKNKKIIIVFIVMLSLSQSSFALIVNYYLNNRCTVTVEGAPGSNSSITQQGSTGSNSNGLCCSVNGTCYNGITANPTPRSTAPIKK